jgi:hypothetical protein
VTKFNGPSDAIDPACRALGESLSNVIGDVSDLQRNHACTLPAPALPWQNDRVDLERRARILPCSKCLSGITPRSTIDAD